MLIVSVRALILYLVVLVTIRIMGKRELGQLQPYEFVIALMIANLASTPMANTGVPISHGLIPILVLLLIHLVLSWLILKNENARLVICGRPTVIIARGRILEHEMRRARYSFTDLFEQAREKGFFSLTDIEYAILETSGTLTMIPKQGKKPLTPDDMGLSRPQEEPAHQIILDGRLHRQNLLESGRDEAWLTGELASLGYGNPREIFFALLDAQGNLHVQGREKKGRWWGA